MRSSGMRLAWFHLLLIVLASPAFGAEPARASAPYEPDKAKELQQAWAKHLELPVQVTNSLGMRFALIPPGQFSMGSPPEEEWHRDDEVLHRVTLTNPFYLATTEVTQRQWKAVMGTNPSFWPAAFVHWQEYRRHRRPSQWA